jgi:hypothetical protein
MVPGIKLLFHTSLPTDGNRRSPKISTTFPTKHNYESLVSSNVKLIMTSTEPKNDTYISIDTGVSGKVFHERYNDLLAGHERGEIIKFDPNEVEKRLILEIKPRPSNTKSK